MLDLNGNTHMPIQPDFLLQHSRSDDADVASVADNCRFDERASAERWRRFDELLDATVPNGAIAWEDWSATAKHHVERFCQVPSSSIPEAFLRVNSGAWLTEIAPGQSVVRLETISRPLDAMGWTLEDLQDMADRTDANSHDGDAHAAMRIFFDTWNRRRDARPSFVAFYDEVEEEAGGEDWGHALRDRLGLGHLGQSGGPRLPIALMRYPLERATRERTGPPDKAACALPTVLDGGMHEFFFSVPRQSTYGATLHLDPDRADVLTAEIVHQRFDYSREHVWRLGYINDARPLQDDDLRVSRDLHLLELREETNRPDFGELLENRA